jgi:hypothetical protein
MMNYWLTYVNMVGMKRQINTCLFMSTSVAYAVGCPKCYCIFNWFFLPKLGFLDFIWTWALHCFTLPVMMNCFERKNIYICHISWYFGKGKMYMLFVEFRKCFRICVKTYWDFSGSNPNKMSITYAIVKTPYDELSIYYIPFAYVYNKLFTFIGLHNN